MMSDKQAKHCTWHPNATNHKSRGFV